MKMQGLPQEIMKELRQIAQTNIAKLKPLNLLLILMGRQNYSPNF